jgi:5-formyltetrahydrofolate cyclo-ligase
MHDDHRAALRRRMRDARRAIPAQARLASADGLAAQLLALPLAPHGGYVAGYWAVDGEIALHAWQLRLPPGTSYCLPVLHEDGRLRFAPWRPGEPLVANRFGIPEPDVASERLLGPEALDAAIMPLVAFDARGHRLGMGGGWYDRSFAFRAQRPAPPLLVGAAFELQRVDALDPADWDVALDAVCTEHATHHTPASR